jgi:NAD(P)-dependent dehydrogenase (short-subunit alcohol dehydrogenase family)
MQSMAGLQGKGAIVIGGGLGMGEATALLLARCGCDVAVVDIDLRRAEDVAMKVEALGRRSTALQYDVVASLEHDKLLATAEEAIPNLQLMATIVGKASFSPILRMTPTVWEEDINTNARYFYFLASAFAQRMVDRNSEGSIVAWASVDGLHASPQHAPYGAAKAAIISLTKSMAAEWAQHRIRVNAVAPGSIATPRIPESPERRERMKASNIPLGRNGTPEEVANVAAFLLSDLSSYITGHTIAVDGGWTVANLLTPVQRLTEPSHGESNAP